MEIYGRHKRSSNKKTEAHMERVFKMVNKKTIKTNIDFKSEACRWKLSDDENGLQHDMMKETLSHMQFQKIENIVK